MWPEINGRLELAAFTTNSYLPSIFKDETYDKAKIKNQNISFSDALCYRLFRTPGLVHFVDAYPGVGQDYCINFE